MAPIGQRLGGESGYSQRRYRVLLPSSIGQVEWFFRNPYEEMQIGLSDLWRCNMKSLYVTGTITHPKDGHLATQNGSRGRCRLYSRAANRQVVSLRIKVNNRKEHFQGRFKLDNQWLPSADSYNLWKPRCMAALPRRTLPMGGAWQRKRGSEGDLLFPAVLLGDPF